MLRDVLKLFHPVIPFVTEELWSYLADGPELLITAPWPDPPDIDAPALVDDLRDIVTGARSFRTQHQIPRATEIPVIVVADVALPSWWLAQLSALGDCTPNQAGQPDPITGHTRLASGSVTGFIPLEGLIDLDAERPRLEKIIAGLEASIAKSTAKLENPNFRERAPTEVIAQEEERLSEVQSELAEQQRHLAELG